MALKMRLNAAKMAEDKAQLRLAEIDKQLVRMRGRGGR